MKDGIYAHYSEVEWDTKRWENFSPDESNFACNCCGEFCFDANMFDMLQSARTIAGVGFHFSSGHRCVRHNWAEGGAKGSRHLWLALDIKTGLNLAKSQHIEKSLRKAGFTTFGYYKSFIHTDDRNGRVWYSEEGRRKWKT